MSRKRECFSRANLKRRVENHDQLKLTITNRIDADKKKEEIINHQLRRARRQKIAGFWITFLKIVFNNQSDTDEKRGSGENPSFHHLLAKSRGGALTVKNIICLWRWKHDLWHKIFDHKTIEEIIEGLKNNSFSENSKRWKLLFEEKTSVQVLQLMIRLNRIKMREEAKETTEDEREELWKRKKKLLSFRQKDRNRKER